METKLFLTMLCCAFCSFSEAQEKPKKGTLGYTFEEEKKDARASGDVFLQRGDTLYLLFDLTDSLQIRKGKYVQWWQRFLTENEKMQDTLDVDLNDLGGPGIYFLKEWKLRSPKTVTSETIEKLTLTTREELIEFYKREEKRMEDRKAKDENFKIYVRVWGFWDLLWYFDKVYLIIPQGRGLYVINEIY